MKRINEVSKLVGVSRRTLQYYDDMGLLTAQRSSDNYRLYDKQELEKIWEILIYKEMNFELKEIVDLIEASDEQKRNYLKTKMEQIREQIIELDVHTGFISMVEIHGMPAAPAEGSGKTYVHSIEEMRKQIRRKVRKEE